MPEICRFFGIVIQMHWDDHSPPHFHASYGEHQAKLTITDLRVTDGDLPPRALGLVIEWGARHRSELIADWDRARAHIPLLRIDPLR